MKNKFIIVSFCAGKFYEKVMSEYLLPSIQKLNLDFYIEKLENLGNWDKNTKLKPLFIKNCLERFPDKNIVFIDADARINSYPDLFDNIPEDCNIACHYLDWNSWYLNTSNIKELISSVVFIRNCTKMTALVKEWYIESQKSSFWEQKVLQNLIDKYKITIYDLPLSYCYLNSLPNGQPPNIKIDNPVISQFQISRNVKRKMII